MVKVTDLQPDCNSRWHPYKSLVETGRHPAKIAPIKVLPW